MKRQFPSFAEQRAVELGPQELMNLIEWQLRRRPRSLRNVRSKYRTFCLDLYKMLKQAERSERLAA
jgi:hypothetical protein